MQDITFGKLRQLATSKNELYNANKCIFLFLVDILQVIHEHVQLLPSSWIIVSQP